MARGHGGPEGVREVMGMWEVGRGAEDGRRLMGGPLYL